MDLENRKKEQLEIEVWSMDKEGTFNGLGMFEVTMSTMSTFLSTLMTYLVIMIQFQ